MVRGLDLPIISLFNNPLSASRVEPVGQQVGDREKHHKSSGPDQPRGEGSKIDGHVEADSSQIVTKYMLGCYAVGHYEGRACMEYDQGDPEEHGRIHDKDIDEELSYAKAEPQKKTECKEGPLGLAMPVEEGEDLGELLDERPIKHYE